jgi:chloride channel protein, CIC family
MQPIPALNGNAAPLLSRNDAAEEAPQEWDWHEGTVAAIRPAQALFADETLEQALRQLVLYGHSGLPVLSHDGERLQGWITRQAVLRTLADSVAESMKEIERGAVAADFAVDDPVAAAHTPSSPLHGYQIVELAVGRDAPAVGKRIGDLQLPPGSVVVAAARGREIVRISPDRELTAGDRIIVLAPGPDEQP